MNKKPKQVGLIGWPIEHSLSPAMHNAAFAELGLDWTYVLVPVQSGQHAPALKELLAQNFVGVNVTMPHKRAVIPHMDELSEAARLIGAVNTIHIQDDKFYGDNTDAIGFLNALKEAGHDPKGMHVAMLGAGGTARAALFSLLRAGVDKVTVINRTVERAAALVDDLAKNFSTASLSFEPLNSETLAALDGQVDLVVNSTSIGMHPQSDASPWPAEVAIPAGAIIYDVIYSPDQTLFLRRAQEAGQKTLNGLGMLVHQGVAAFELWTGRQAPLAIMRQACLKELGLNKEF
ncbi:MAG: shikimate dehydrogenase [Chloroflexota bacterium]